MILDPFVDVFDGGFRRLFGDSPPAATGTGGAPYMVGDIVWNVYPTLGMPQFWRCIVAGDPGTWEAVGRSCSQTFTLTNAQTKAMFSAPTRLFATPGAGLAIDIESVFFENVFGTAAFTAGAAFGLYYGTDATGVLALANTVAATFLTSPTANQVIKVAGGLATNLASAVINKPITLACITQDFATGAGNMIMKVAYRVHEALL
jgi:hypothetical protein